MKRRVIQIANSTQLISLPRKWTQQFGIKKGDELEVEARGNKIEISTEKGVSIEKAELNIDNLAPMILRCLVAIYKKGVDEVKVTLNNPNLAYEIQKSIRKETVGYEIVDQGKNYCLIKQVSGELGDFDAILRRTFLLLINMSTDCINTIKSKDFQRMNDVAFLEEANNRFTTTCRRLINKKNPTDVFIGPLYYIIEELENVADQYKYLCQYLYQNKDKKINLKPAVTENLEKTHSMLRSFYSLYYKFDKEELVKIAKWRKEIIETSHELFESKIDGPNAVVVHNIMTIAQKIFCLTGPYLVNAI